MRDEQWFERHSAAYISELLALRPVVPWQGVGSKSVSVLGGLPPRLAFVSASTHPPRCWPWLRGEVSRSSPAMMAEAHRVLVQARDRFHRPG